MNLTKYIPNDTPKSDQRPTHIPVKTVVLSVLFSVLAVFLMAMALIYCRNIRRLHVEDKQLKNADFGQRKKAKRNMWGRLKPVSEDNALDVGELPEPYMLPQNAQIRNSAISLKKASEAEDGAYRIAVNAKHPAERHTASQQMEEIHAAPARLHELHRIRGDSPLRQAYSTEGAYYVDGHNEYGQQVYAQPYAAPQHPTNSTSHGSNLDASHYGDPYRVPPQTYEQPEYAMPRPPGGMSAWDDTRNRQHVPMPGSWYTDSGSNRRV